MNERPEGLDDASIVPPMAELWGVDGRELRYLPIGFGSYHWLVTDDAGGRHFATVDDLEHKLWLGEDPEVVFDGLRAAFETARLLREEAGLTFVLSPLRHRGGGTLHRLDDRYALSLFPFVEGRTSTWGSEVGSEDRARLIRLLAELHVATPAVRATARRREAELPGRAALEAALAELGSRWETGPYGESARRLLTEHAGGVGEWLATFDALVAHVEGGGAPEVITHGEPHGGNFIWTSEGPLLVDWDQAALAPPERDLWMLDDGTPGAFGSYTAITGRAVDPSALTLYRLAWALADLAEFVSVFRAEHAGTLDIEKSWQALGATLADAPDVPQRPWRAAPEPHEA